MQNKTSSDSAGLPESNPLAGPVDIETIRTKAKALLATSSDTSAHRWIDQICDLAQGLFSGRVWNYQPIDLRYHDFLHTLQASSVFLALAASTRLNLAPDLAPSDRELELGLAAILLHDSGYLKARGDDQGTGAKYTHHHVLRSCSLAASLLPPLGCRPDELEDVLGIIRCTGLNGNPPKTRFSSPRMRLVACMVATADYVGQMAAPEYPEKLPSLFAEFTEADEFSGTPRDKRPFASAKALLEATSAFWKNFVLPKLECDFDGVHRLLATPYPDGPNPYLRAIETNLSLVAARARA